MTDTGRMRPQCLVIAGPNGAGKSSSAPELLKDALGVAAFVNADVIAQGLSAYRPEAVAVQAGRVALRRLAALVDAGEDFAFESTLSGRSLERLLDDARLRGYDVHIFYLWLPSAALAVARVQQRARLGGHDIPPDVVTRRYQRSIRNIPRLLFQLASSWRLYDASVTGPPRLVADGVSGAAPTVVDAGAWQEIQNQIKEWA